MDSILAAVVRSIVMPPEEGAGGGAPPFGTEAAAVSLDAMMAEAPPPVFRLKFSTSCSAAKPFFRRSDNSSKCCCRRCCDSLAWALKMVATRNACDCSASAMAVRRFISTSRRSLFNRSTVPRWLWSIASSCVVKRWLSSRSRCMVSALASSCWRRREPSSASADSCWASALALRSSACSHASSADCSCARCAAWSNADLDSASLRTCRSMVTSSVRSFVVWAASCAKTSCRS